MNTTADQWVCDVPVVRISVMGEIGASHQWRQLNGKRRQMIPDMRVVAKILATTELRHTILIATEWSHQYCETHHASLEGFHATHGAWFVWNKNCAFCNKNVFGGLSV